MDHLTEFDAFLAIIDWWKFETCFISLFKMGNNIYGLQFFNLVLELISLSLAFMR